MRQVIMAGPDEHIVAGIRFDPRMASFKAGRIDSGKWRVKWVRVQMEPLAVPFVVSNNGNGEPKELMINVARLVRAGDLCKPVDLAIELLRWRRSQQQERA